MDDRSDRRKCESDGVITWSTELTRSRCHGDMKTPIVDDPHVVQSFIRLRPRVEDIMLIVAGGPGTHSVYVPCFGNSRAVTRVIE